MPMTKFSMSAAVTALKTSFRPGHRKGRALHSSNAIAGARLRKIGSHGNRHTYSSINPFL